MGATIILTEHIVLSINSTELSMTQGLTFLLGTILKSEINGLTDSLEPSVSRGVAIKISYFQSNTGGSEVACREFLFKSNFIAFCTFFSGYQYLPNRATNLQ